MVENLNWRESKSGPAMMPQLIEMRATHNERQPVGADLKYIQDRLLELGNRLMRETDPEASSLIENALDALRNQAVRISVVGQVNAGKTTLVNALARQPGLLPVSSAPGTSVVTRLHFGLHGYPQPCSNFQFFDDREWKRLAEDGGKLRELAERFLPGFNSEQLQQQIQAMRYRAQARLGPSFKKLLGSHHSFSSINPEIITRYVSTCSSTASAAESQEPYYADITRSADLFFDEPPFGYPLTLIDTPGTNDPFLVREEMTLRCLDASDVCIVVIDATKGVTEADMGLFRLLSGINAQRLIIFINKVDQLNGSTEVIDGVTNRIANSVFSALGNSSPPVIIGSAQIAEFNRPASRLDEAFRPPCNTKRDGVLTTKATNSTTDIEQNLPDYKGPNVISALEDAISQLLRRGQSAHYNHQASATLLTLADGTRLQAAYQVNSYKNELDIHKAKIDDAIKRQRAIEYLQDLSEQMTRATDATISSLRHLSENYEKHAQANLERLIVSYAAFAKREFLKKHKRKLPAKAVHFDTYKIRQQIFVTNSKDYNGVRQEMANTLRVAAARLMFLMNQTQSDMDIELNFDSVSTDFLYPSQSPLGQTLAIDLGEPYWKQWWRQRTTSKEVANSLEQLILQEFMPMVTDLVKLTKSELEAGIENKVLQLSISSTEMVQLLKNQQLAIAPSGPQELVQALADDNLELGGPASEGQTKKTADQPINPRHLQYQVDIANCRHQRVEQLVHEFRSLTDACKNLIAEPNAKQVL